MQEAVTSLLILIAKIGQNTIESVVWTRFLPKLDQIWPNEKIRWKPKKMIKNQQMEKLKNGKQNEKKNTKKKEMKTKKYI